MVIGAALQLLAEDIRIGLAVAPGHVGPGEAAHGGVEEGVPPSDDGNAGVEDKGAPRRQTPQGSVENGDGETLAERPAAMAVGPPRWVEQVRRVGDDQVELARHPRQQVAPDGRRIGRIGEGSVDACEAERGIVDVEHRHLGLRAGLGDEDAARPRAAADIGRAMDGGGAGGQLRLDGRGEAVGVRAEEHGIGGAGWISGMQEHLAVQAGQPQEAAPERSIALGHRHLGPAHQLEQPGRHHIR